MSLRYKILILKEECNNFEKIFSDAFRSEGVSVYKVYKSNNKYLEFIKKVHRNLPIFDRCYDIWFDEWKRKIDTYDRIIIFDISLSASLLDFLRRCKCENKVIIWFWNYYERCPDVDLSGFKICSFDRNNCNMFGWIYVQQFYIVKFLNYYYKNSKSITIKNGVSFVASDKGRYPTIVKIAEKLKESNIDYEFFVIRKIKSEGDSYLKLRIITSSKMIDYVDTLKKINQYSCVLEIVVEGQSGISLRALEAIVLRKKLITNNKNIKSYDFYNSDNIFILGLDKDLTAFMKIPFHEIKNDLLNKYDLSSWINSVINVN